jgi:WD40 repeat protein
MSGLSSLFRGPVRLYRNWKADLGDHVIALAWSPSGKTIAAAAVSGPVTLYNSSNGQPISSLKGHSFGTTSLSWRRCNGDESMLATAGQDGKARLWAVPSGQEIASVAGGAAWVEHMSWHPSLDLLVPAAGKKMRLWSADGKMVREYPDHLATIADLAWRPKTEELTSATYGRVALWSMQNSTPTRTLEWKGSILKLAWSADGSHLAHGNQDASVHYWIMASGQDLQMAGYPLKVREVAFDPTGAYLATGGGDIVTVWDCRPPGPEGTTPLSFEEHTAPISVLAYQARGPILASGGQDGKVILFQPGKFKKSLATSNLNQPVSQMAWSPDDRLLAVATERGEVIQYSLT